MVRNIFQIYWSVFLVIGAISNACTAKSTKDTQRKKSVAHFIKPMLLLCDCKFLLMNAILEYLVINLESCILNHVSCLLYLVTCYSGHCFGSISGCTITHGIKARMIKYCSCPIPFFFTIIPKKQEYSKGYKVRDTCINLIRMPTTFY